MAKKSAPKAKRAPAAKKTGQAVAIHKPQLPAAPVTFLEFLDRASRDPEFDAAKFKIILDAKERQEDRAKEDAFDEAMAQAQAAMAPIRADMENSQTHSKYASDVALDRAIRPIYSKFGFALSFGTGDNPPADHVRVTCRISCAGHRRTEHLDIPVVTTGPKGTEMMTKVHATGSAVTYGNRYLLLSIFNLKVIKKKGETFADDDGVAAGGPPPVITAAQRKKIDDDLKATNSDLNAFLYMLTKINGDVEIKDTASIPVTLYETAVAKLAQKKQAMAAPK